MKIAKGKLVSGGRNWANMCGTTGNKGRVREKGRWRRCERRREVSRDVEMGGGGGGAMSPQCSAVSASSAGGAGGVPSPSLPLTQTPMHHSIMDALHWCQREKD